MGQALACPPHEPLSLPACAPQILLQHTPEQEEMRAFPGPLGKYVPVGRSRRPRGPLGRRGCGSLSVCSFFRDDTHKVDVINFAQNKATKCLQNEHLIDKESASLLWSFIVLLCRQNGVRRSFRLGSPRQGWPGDPPAPRSWWAFRAGLCAGSVPRPWEASGRWFGVKGALGSQPAACPPRSWPLRAAALCRGGAPAGPGLGLPVTPVASCPCPEQPFSPDLQTVVGTDVAELLLRDHRTVWLPGKSPDEANLIDFTNEAVEQVEEEESGEAQLSFLTDSQAASSLEKETERFRELLLYGRKKVSGGGGLQHLGRNALSAESLAVEFP